MTYNTEQEHATLKERNGCCYRNKSPFTHLPIQPKLASLACA